MEPIVNTIAGYVSDPELAQTLFLTIGAAAVFMLVAGIGYIFFSATSPVQRRLDSLVGVEQEPEEQGERRRVRIQTVLGPISAYVLPKEEIERSQVTARLAHAGFRSPEAVTIFQIGKIVLMVAAPLLTWYTCTFFPKITTASVLTYCFIAGGLAMILPNAILDRLLERRFKKLRDGFPDALDLLVVCVEAGLGLTQALQRVADELMVSHPELATEIALVNAEVRAGVDSTSALKNFAERTGLDDIKGLVSLLVQTLRFGTSIAESLRVYSAEFRDKRMQKAEERAAKIGTKMIFPLVVFMFPAFFVVAVGPAVVGLVEVFTRL